MTQDETPEATSPPVESQGMPETVETWRIFDLHDLAHAVDRRERAVQAEAARLSARGLVQAAAQLVRGPGRRR
jgi:hypothetical protein